MNGKWDGARADEHTNYLIRGGIFSAGRPGGIPGKCDNGAGRRYSQAGGTCHDGFFYELRYVLQEVPISGR